MREKQDSRSRLSGLLIFGLALGVRLLYLASMGGSPYYDARALMGTDCYRFYEWALGIAGGDLVGQGVFNQAPLYAYFLAFWLKLGGSAFLVAPRLAQFILGSVSAWLAYDLARSYRGKTAGVAAGLLAAFYGPLIFYDGAFLRDGLAAFLNTALVFSMFQAQSRPSLGRGLGTGILFGLGLLCKQSIAVMVLVIPWWLLEAARAERGNEDVLPPWYKRGFSRLLAGGAAGLVLVMSVLVARNVAAGAPALAIDRRGAMEFIAGNLPGSPAAGWFLTMSTLEMKEKSERRLLPAIGAVWEYYRGRPLALIYRQAQKAWAYIYGYEVPNNLNYYVEREYVLLFKLPLPVWPEVFGLGLVGLWFCRRQWRRGIALYGYVTLYSLGVIAFYVTDRFRIPVVPVLCVFAGAGVAGIIELFKEGRRGAAGFALAAAAAVAVLTWPHGFDRFRAGDYYNLARFHAAKGETRPAWEWAQRGRESAERVAGRGESAETHYDRAWFMFLMGEPLPAVEGELIKARKMGGPEWLMNSVLLLQNEVDKRKASGDPLVQGLRFFSP